MKICAVIPARMESTRFPGKPLTMIQGQPLLAYPLAVAQACSAIAEVIVATANDDIAAAAKRLGARPVRTTQAHTTGTDRMHEVAALTHWSADWYLNIQVDEVALKTSMLQFLIEQATRAHEAMATLSTPFRALDEFKDANRVKVLADSKDHAVSFSRGSIVELSRTITLSDLARLRLQRHIGVYLFSQQALQAFAACPPCLWETTERLEQLRALHLGLRPLVCEVDHPGVAIDVPEDVALVASHLERL